MFINKNFALLTIYILIFSAENVIIDYYYYEIVYIQGIFKINVQKEKMMSKRDNKVPSLKQVSHQLFLMVIGYAVIIIFVILAITNLSIKKTDDVLQNKVISMSASLDVQMKLNMNSFLARMEALGTLPFGEEDTYTYDATDPNNDEFEALNAEKAITEKMYNLCIMENFVDYGIVYRNNRTVGKISNGTSSLFGDKMFEELSSMITRQRTNDGWSAGYKNNFKRIYYVKRVNDNAVLVLSFYTSELESVFDNPETLSDMDIRLVNKDYNILYSSNKRETGSILPNDILKRVQGKTSASVMDDKYLVSVSACNEDWYVICSIPTDIILKEKNEMSLFIFMVGAIAAVLAMLLCAVVSLRMTAPVKQAVALLDTKANNDQLTGILNKQSFTDSSERLLNSAPAYEQHALILLDLDNFKGINDTLGHTYGDKVLSKTGSILRAEFSNEDFVGRVGGDEFCILVNSTPADDMDYRDFIKEKCKSLCMTFNDNYTGEDGSYKVSASIGVAIFQHDGETFEELYDSADKALYRSKKTGKDTYSFFDKSIDSEVAGK